MNKSTAFRIEMAVIALCVASILMIFQSYSLTLFSVGCITVVISGLAFNLIPFCREGVPIAKLFKVMGIVVVILLLAVLLGIIAANAYVWYLSTLR